MQADANALRQWNFRIARLHGDTNPYRHLLPEGLLSKPWPQSQGAGPRGFLLVFN